jgi:RNA polymerase sigma-70 factor (ECF subfamily)
MIQQQEAQVMVDAAQFEAIFERFHTPINSYIYRLVSNHEQASDLTQDVFMKAYRVLAGGTTIPEGALSSWLYRIASNTATDVLRRRLIIAWLPLEDWGIDDGSHFEQHIANYEIVHRVLGQIPKGQVNCLLLHYCEGYTCEQIAGLIDISLTAVRMRLVRARESFIKIYKIEAGTL